MIGLWLACSITLSLVALFTPVSTHAQQAASILLEQLKQAVPGVSRVAVLWQPGAFDERTERDTLTGAEVAGRALGCSCSSLKREVPPISTGLLKMTEARAGALTVLPGAMFFNERRRLAELAGKNWLARQITD